MTQEWPFYSVDDIRRANERKGLHFFEPATMRFFHSRIGNAVYNRRYFISSEQFDYRSPRLYTIRRANDDGSIDTVGEFQAYSSHAQARRAIEALA